MIQPGFNFKKRVRRGGLVRVLTIHIVNFNNAFKGNLIAETSKCMTVLSTAGNQCLINKKVSNYAMAPNEENVDTYIN